MSNRLRIAVTGCNGQVVTSLIQQGGGQADVVAFGRPELDLAHPESVRRVLRSCGCDIFVNAAAYTDVDKAELEESYAIAVNGLGAGAVADVARECHVPIIQLSTDFVFNGEEVRPYNEHDATNPTGAYGRSKLLGELQVRDANANHIILRTAWVYSPFSANFVRTILRLGEMRDEVDVVADQFGNPTYAIDIADAILKIANRVCNDSDPALRGVFHLAGEGEASRAELAEAVFEEAVSLGRVPVRVRHISTAEYPTLAKRPKNSRLDTSKLKAVYGVTFPNWRQSVSDCVQKIII